MKNKKTLKIISALIFGLLMTATSSLMTQAEKYTFQLQNDYFCYNTETCQIWSAETDIPVGKIFYIYTMDANNNWTDWHGIFAYDYENGQIQFNFRNGDLPIWWHDYRIWCVNCDTAETIGCWQYIEDSGCCNGTINVADCRRRINQEFLAYGFSGNNIEIKNLPNPFTANTEINYAVIEDGFVNIDLFSMTGEKISQIIAKDEKAGIYKVNFDSGNIPAGVYTLVMQSGLKTTLTKMLIVK